MSKRFSLFKLNENKYKVCCLLSNGDKIYLPLYTIAKKKALSIVKRFNELDIYNKGYDNFILSVNDFK